jgi:hypothetical protein
MSERHAESKQKDPSQPKMTPKCPEMKLLEAKDARRPGEK